MKLISSLGHKHILFKCECCGTVFDIPTPKKECCDMVEKRLLIPEAEYACSCEFLDKFDFNKWNIRKDDADFLIRRETIPSVYIECWIRVLKTAFLIENGKRWKLKHDSEGIWAIRY